MRSQFYYKFRKNFNLITEYDFYWKLAPKCQTELIDLLFGSFLELFTDTFEGQERAFVNYIVVSLRYKYYDHNEVISQYKYDVDEAYFITSGSVAVCESTSYKDPIVVYGPGAFIHLYQVFFEEQIGLDYIALESNSFVT